MMMMMPQETDKPESYQENGKGIWRGGGMETLGTVQYCCVT